MTECTIVVERRFRGPDTGGGTGNGGYFCGLVARAVGPTARTIEITRTSGVPLDRPLRVRARDGGGMVEDDEGPIARVVTERIAVAAPAPPPVAVAAEAGTRFLAGLEAGEIAHTFPECFVCGHRRAAGDGLRLFAGPLPEGRAGDPPGARAAAWRPAPAFLDESGCLRPEFVWAALDCPGGWAIADAANTGTLQVEILAPVPGDQRLIVMGWPMRPPAPRPGSRRRYAGTALFDGRGRLLALGAAIWVAPRTG